MRLRIATLHVSSSRCRAELWRIRCLAVDHWGAAGSTLVSCYFEGRLALRQVYLFRLRRLLVFSSASDRLRDEVSLTVDLGRENLKVLYDWLLRKSICSLMHEHLAAVLRDPRFHAKHHQLTLLSLKTGELLLLTSLDLLPARSNLIQNLLQRLVLRLEHEGFLFRSLLLMFHILVLGFLVLHVALELLYFLL